MYIYIYIYSEELTNILKTIGESHDEEIPNQIESQLIAGTEKLYNKNTESQQNQALNHSKTNIYFIGAGVHVLVRSLCCNLLKFIIVLYIYIYIYIYIEHERDRAVTISDLYVRDLGFYPGQRRNFLRGAYTLVLFSERGGRFYESMR